MSRYTRFALVVAATTLAGTAIAEDNIASALWEAVAGKSPASSTQTPDKAATQTQRTPQKMTHNNNANGTFIACPLQEARTEVVNNLPSGWWQTPQIGTLQGVRIQTIGGDITLVCGYWAYGTTASVMRLAPDGSRCETRAGGFVCR